jgi:hypothetical protein
MIFTSRTGGNARIIPSWCLGKILRLRWSLVPVLRWRRRPVGSGSGTPCTTPDHLCRTRGPTTELRPFLGKRRRDIQGGRSGMVFLRHFEGHCSWIVAANCPRHSIYPLTSYRRFGNSFLHMLPAGTVAVFAGHRQIGPASFAGATFGAEHQIYTPGVAVETCFIHSSAETDLA